MSDHSREKKTLLADMERESGSFLQKDRMRMTNGIETTPPLEPSSSVLLLSQLQGGDQSAGDQLYHRYAWRLRQLSQGKLSKLLRSRLDADDIVQSVFRRFFATAGESIYDCSRDEDLWNVLLVITLNRLRTEEVFQRAGKRDVRRNVNMEGLNELTSFSHSSFASSYLRAGVEEALEKLPEHFGQVIKLRLEGLEVAEIAQRVERSKRTVERILQEALTQLRALLQPEDDRDDAEKSSGLAGDRPVSRGV